MPAVSLDFDTEELAERYEQLSVDRQFKAGKILLNALQIKPGEKLLDIGAGTGLLAEYAAQRAGPEGAVIGIDPLPLRIQIARRKAQKNLAFETGNAEDLSRFADASFDAVYLNAVFHWIPNKKLALREIHRVLRPGGRLGLSTVSREHQTQLGAIRVKVMSREPFASYARALQGGPGWVSAAELENLLLEAGFSVQSIDIQRSARLHDSPSSVIAFLQASSFGNMLGHLPAELQEAARTEIERELEALRTAEGIRIEAARLVAVAVKP